VIPDDTRSRLELFTFGINRGTSAVMQIQEAGIFSSKICVGHCDRNFEQTTSQLPGGLLTCPTGILASALCLHGFCLQQIKWQGQQRASYFAKPSKRRVHADAKSWCRKTHLSVGCETCCVMRACRISHRSNASFRRLKEREDSNASIKNDNKRRFVEAGAVTRAKAPLEVSKRVGVDP
jgi:hypothetical protein